MEKPVQVFKKILEFEYKDSVEKNNIKYHTYTTSFMRHPLESIKLFLPDIDNDNILEVLANGNLLFTLVSYNNIFKIDLVCDDCAYTRFEFVLYIKDKIENVKAEFIIPYYENREKQRKAMLGKIFKTEYEYHYYFKRFGKIFRVSDGVIHQLDEKTFRKTYLILKQQDVF